RRDLGARKHAGNAELQHRAGGRCARALPRQCLDPARARAHPHSRGDGVDLCGRRRARVRPRGPAMNAPSPVESDPYRIGRAIRELFEGRRNTTGTVTLTANAASTVVAHVNFGSASVPHLTPRTANAAAEIGNGTLFVSARANGSFTLA